MIPNPIEEIKRICHQLGANADYDIRRIFAELLEAKATSNRNYVEVPVRDPSGKQRQHPKPV